jgi:RNA polymerase sigma-54 factor
MPPQSLQLSQDQRLHLVLAPQLRQSLEMLQAPVMELRAMIRAELDKNPTLEEVSTDTAQIEVEPAVSKENEDQKSLDFRKEFEILARLDDEWREYFFQEKDKRPYSSQDQERHDFLMDSIVQRESLQEHLLQQLNLGELKEEDHALGEVVVGSINDDGYLTTSIAELAATTGADVSHMEEILEIVRDFDPPGVGATDLRECLLLQLERLGKSDSLAGRIVSTHLEKLAGRKLQEIARALKVTVKEAEEAANFIATLDPKPGRIYSSESSPYVTPEVVVKKVNDQYILIMNDDDLPRLRISRHYRSLMNDEDTGKDVRDYIQERVRSSAFLIRSIHQRQQTIYRIATEIVRVQTDFLDNGITHLKPLTMAEVATAVGLHETTVSRAVAGKHLQTPQGVFELKYFFTPGLMTDDGNIVSNKTVKDAILTLVAEESPSDPLSDQEILEILTKRGIHLARRTVAKYRIALKIPPSHMRRRYG